MNLKQISYEVENVLGDQYQRVIESPKTINNEKIESCFSVADLMAPFSKLEDDKKESEIGESLAKIFIITQQIKEKYTQARIVFNQVREKFEEEVLFKLSAKELEEVEFKILNFQNPANSLITEKDKLYSAICKHYAHNASVSSGVFQDGAVFTIEELEAIDIKVAYHAKKTAFDQACMSSFQKHPEDYDKGYHVEYVGPKHDFNQLLGDAAIKKDQLAIVFVNLKPMDNFSIPKFSQITDPETGEKREIEEVHLTDKQIKSVHCNVVGKSIVVKIPIYMGILISKES